MRQLEVCFAGLKRLSLELAVVVLVTTAFLSAAASPVAANEKYAGIVIDAKNGSVLYEDRADARRYPASLTKMMTLYLVFEALESGRVSKDTRITFSRKASAEPPTKIGVPAGQSITVDQAIRALVVRSANDVATAVAEHLGGSETQFAQMMTAKARQLGMNATTFRNAHGLPNGQQTTTARDMARLGIALREHFPQYYDYFSTRSFTYAGRTYNNHNRLLGSVRGTDGIKTGYIRASGFNLVTSVNSGGKSIVAVVMGGRTGRSRDAHMADLVRRTLPNASTGSGRQLIAKAPASRQVAAVLPSRAPIPESRPEAAPVNAYAPEPASGPVPSAPVLQEAAGSVEEIDTLQTASTPVRGWVIQVASMPSEAEARRILADTVGKVPTILADATPFTETFQMDGRTYHRARYGGFGSKTAAWDACESLKRQGVACYAVEN